MWSSPYCVPGNHRITDNFCLLTHSTLKKSFDTILLPTYDEKRSSILSHVPTAINNSKPYFCTAEAALNNSRTTLLCGRRFAHAALNNSRTTLQCSRRVGACRCDAYLPPPADMNIPWLAGIYMVSPARCRHPHSTHLMTPHNYSFLDICILYLMSTNNNPTGKNQYKNHSPPDDPHIAALLRDYHRRGLGSCKILPELLQKEHGITLGEASVAKQLKAVGLTGSGATTKQLPANVKRQLILDQMAQDPAGRQGPSTVKEAIAWNTGIHLTRLDEGAEVGCGKGNSQMDKELRVGNNTGGGMVLELTMVSEEDEVGRIPRQPRKNNKYNKDGRRQGSMESQGNKTIRVGMEKQGIMVKAKRIPRSAIISSVRKSS
ncbi:uncharacterized protein LACBIDRAFT_330157 [Laccaria bicolor S238N-H82]|uniref:Predicted protein n=1 Tax=Laccaria bicolor (strain S238N-H82 / ATCC MYA-4686) TaxID=486041 RepID=B0DKH1_LACBS|nr:uncharacterized protein LACBIDRAFT_330157 [Laccaria bicolor S238N-H82]EDR05063.1 predicted protein [Laccaria bicolor S238N-H82]|eukprot:XP_001884453.1 predicted protein [Laccaria bicolor S238N-H82]